VTATTRTPKKSEGALITLAQLEEDPYPIYARLQQREPISRIPALGMWYVTRYEDVRAILMDTERFTTAAPESLIFDTFGTQVLTTEGAQHDSYRRALQQSFTPRAVRQNLDVAIQAATTRLIDEFKMLGKTDLRVGFAARLPIHTMLALFGLPKDDENFMRRWYDVFERALANFSWDPGIRRTAHDSVADFHRYLDGAIARLSGVSDNLLAKLVHARTDERLSHEEILRNLSIVLFGGISTVEALILNSLWALFMHPETLERVRGDSSLFPAVIDETIRWLSPVQSATRHVVHDTVYRDIHFPAGAVVNCMLGAANRDPAVFQAPERFDIDRVNRQRHLGFAVGTHACLGLHLAKLEARIAVEQLVRELPDLRLIDPVASTPRGYEFRQPRAMPVMWETDDSEGHT
jgi:cytochrome P450